VAHNLPKAFHVLDRFHIVKLFNDKLSDWCREAQRETETMLQKKVLKGTRWLLLKHPVGVPERLDHPGAVRRRADAPAVGRDPGASRAPVAQRVGLSDLDRSAGGDEHADQADAEAGLWVSGHGVFQAENLRDPHDDLRMSRMSLFFPIMAPT
jgi:hypothetical protein